MESNKQNYLESIFKSAEQRMKEFKMPLVNEGKFEALMYGIWLGMKALDEFGIPQNYEESYSIVEDFLVNYAERLGISPDKKVERLFVFRDEEWNNETMALAKSNYPQTKQYLPEYLYLCFVDSPLVLYGDATNLHNRAEQIDTSDLIEFLAAFEIYYNSLIGDFKTFMSNKSDGEQIKNNDATQNIIKNNKSVYTDFENQIIKWISVQDNINNVPLEDILYMPSITLRMLDKLVCETILSYKVLDLSNGVDSITVLFKKDLDYLQNNRKGLVECAKPMLEKDLETRKRCVELLRSTKLDKDEKEDLESVIPTGEEMLNKLLSCIDNTIKMIDIVINAKKNNNKPQTPIKPPKKGCISVLMVIAILIGLCGMLL